MACPMVNVIYILSKRGKAGGPQKLGEMALDANGRVRVFWSFLCGEMSLVDSSFLSVSFLQDEACRDHWVSPRHGHL